MRECGLKLVHIAHGYALVRVTPRAGVWIETPYFNMSWSSVVVTPRAGVWIETSCVITFTLLPSRHSPCGSVD